MEELIRKKDAISACYDGFADNRDDCAFNIGKIHPVEYTHPKIAHWKRVDIWDDMIGERWVKWECSNCGYVRKCGWAHNGGEKPKAKYCEECGAEMDLPERMMNEVSYKRGCPNAAV